MADNFLRDLLVRQWLNGIEPAWTVLAFDSLRALRQEPSGGQSAIRFATGLTAEEISGSAVARNTQVLLRRLVERDGLPLTATGNLSRAAVAEMRRLVEWPDYDQDGALQFHTVINEPDFLPLHVVRLLAQTARLVRAARQVGSDGAGKSDARRIGAGQPVGSAFSLGVLANRSGIFWSWIAWLVALPQLDIGIVLWSLSVAAGDWETSERLARLCTIPKPEMLTGSWDRSAFALVARILRPLLWFGVLEYRREVLPGSQFEPRHLYRKAPLFDRLIRFDIRMEIAEGVRH